MWSVARNTFRECQRRPFVYVVAVAVSLLALASHLFQAFSFGAGDIESTNLSLSAVFTAGLVHATFLGTLLIIQDLERGTLGLVLTTPVGLARYLAGRLLGLVGSAAVTCSLVGAALLGIFAFSATDRGGDVIGPALFSGWARALLPIIVLESAALAASSLASRVFAPVVLVAVFVAGSLAGGAGIGLFLPDFSIFGLEAGASPSIPLLSAYTLIYTAVFFLVAYVTLASRPPLRSQA